MRKFRNLFLVILSIIFIFLGSLTLIGESLSATILKPYETNNYLDEDMVYQDVQVLIEEGMSDKIATMDSSMDILLIFFIDIINKSITKEWVTSISDDIQNTVWDYITDKNDKLATIPLIKFNNYINEMIKNDNSIIIDKNPIFKNKLYLQIDELFPEIIDINKYLNDNLNYIENAKKYYQLINLFLIYMYLTIGFILILIFILNSNFRKSAKWIGITFTITSIVTFTMAILINLVDKNNIYNQIKYIEYYNRFETSIKNFIGLLINDITVNLGIYSSIMLIIGLFFLFLNKITAKRVVKVKSNQK